MTRFAAAVLAFLLTIHAARADLQADLLSPHPIVETAIDMMAVTAAAEGDTSLSACMGRLYFTPGQHFATLRALLAAPPSADLASAIKTRILEPCRGKLPPYPKTLREIDWKLGWFDHDPMRPYDRWLEPEAVTAALTGAIAYADAQGHSHAIGCLRRIGSDTALLQKTSANARANHLSSLVFAVLRLTKAECDFPANVTLEPYGPNVSGSVANLRPQEYWSATFTATVYASWHRSTIAAPRHYACQRDPAACGPEISPSAVQTVPPKPPTAPSAPLLKHRP